MLNRLLIILYSLSSFATSPCPQGLEVVGGEVDKVLDLSPFSCVNKLQNFELTDVNEFCSCQNTLPFKVTKRDFQTENEKLKELGSALLAEVFSIADLMSELNNELSASDLQDVDQSKLSNCNLPSLLSDKNLSCGGSKDTKKLATMFSALGSDISPDLVEIFGLSKEKKFDVSSLQSQIKQIIRVSTGDIILEGRGKYCLPPKYQYLANSSSQKYSSVGIAELLRSEDAKLEQKFKDNATSKTEKNKLASKALGILGARCEKIKKNINRTVCDKTLTKFRSAPASDDVDNFIYTASIDVSTPDEVDSLVGKFNAACESITNSDEVSKKSLRNNVYNKILTSTEESEKSGPSELMLKNVKMANDFPEKIVNYCEKICDESAPYPKSGCKLKDIDSLLKEYNCNQENKSFDENIICAFVDVEKSRKTEEELLRIARSSNQEEIDAFFSSDISKEKRESFAKLMRFEKAKKEKVNVLDRFLDGHKVEYKEDPKKSTSAIVESIDSRANNTSDISKVQEDSTLQSSAQDVQMTDATKSLDRNVSALAGTSVGSFAMSSSSRKSSAIPKGEVSKTKFRSGSLGEKAPLSEKSKRISDLMDRLDNAHSRVNNSLSKVSSLRSDMNSANKGNSSFTNSTKSSVASRGTGVTHNDQASGSTSFVNNNNTPIQRNTPAIEYEKVKERATDLIGKGSNGVAASDERRRALSRSDRGASPISKLFQGELSNSLVRASLDSTRELKRVQVPDRIKMIDLAKLLKNSSEISPGEAFILYEVADGRRAEVTLVPTFAKFGRKEVFTGYRPLNVDYRNKSLVKKLTAHKNLFKEI